MANPSEQRAKGVAANNRGGVAARHGAGREERSGSPRCLCGCGQPVKKYQRFAGRGCGPRMALKGKPNLNLKGKPKSEWTRRETLSPAATVLGQIILDNKVQANGSWWVGVEPGRFSGVAARERARMSGSKFARMSPHTVFDIPEPRRKKHSAYSEGGAA